MLQPNLPRARRCFGTGTPCRKSPSCSWDTAREELRGKRNKGKVARAKGTNQELNEERGQESGEVVDLEGERVPKKQWRKEGDVGSGILEKLGKRGNCQDSAEVGD